jgi:hypothetical protein
MHSRIQTITLSKQIRSFYRIWAGPVKDMPRRRCNLEFNSLRINMHENL